MYHKRKMRQEKAKNENKEENSKSTINCLVTFYFTSNENSLFIRL